MIFPGDFGAAVPNVEPGAGGSRRVLVDPLTNRDVADFVVRTARLTAAAADQLDAGDELQAIGTLRVLGGVVNAMVDRLLGPKRPL